MADDLCNVTTFAEKGLAVLRMSRDSLELSDREAFLAACRQLLDTDQPRLVIDLRGLRRIFSIFVGTIMDVNARARKEDRHLALMASGEITKLFRTVVGSEVLEIYEAGPPGNGGGRKPSGRAMR